MGNRSHSKKHHQRKTIRFYLRIYFLSFFVGLTVFILGTYFVKPNPPCANSISCQSSLSEKIENGAVGMFQGHKIVAPTVDTAYDTAISVVLGTKDTNEKKHIYIDLEKQTLYAYEGNNKVFQTLIASGRWGRTPTGNFNIWQKLRATRMSGGSGADAYDLPNVPYVMYFYHDFGLHGAYWHNNFGHTMSHGCVNMRPVDAKALFEWADGPENSKLGTPVSVCNQFIGPDKCVQENPIQS
ncbi:MAG: L,D-transpeptidase [Candidatus Levyibacteriota bacterium]|nr:MAG: L,D-transpeptidase [Candidatus Levybacteria bacterium]